jgi:hypothetical protein
MCHRVLALSREADSPTTGNREPTNQPVTEAINHPVGYVTQALLNLWFNRKPNDNDQLPADIEPVFTQLCDVRVDSFRHGRVLLASRLIALFRVDRPWTERHLLPLFDWTVNPAEVKAVWDGFLWSPRLYRPLLIAFKSQFLETARYYADLGDHARQFAAFLTYAALEPIDGFTAQDFRSAIRELPQEGLEESAEALTQVLEGAGDQREEYWRNRVQPFWQHVWPKSRELATLSVAESLIRLSIAAGSEFPAALTAVQGWLQPIEHLEYVVRRLHESGLSSRFPEDSLRLLNVTIDDQPWPPKQLRQCLKAIADSAPGLQQDYRFQRLHQYLQRHGL